MFYVAYFKNGGGGRAPSPSSTTADRARPRCGCTWEPSVRAASSPPPMRIPRRRPTRWSTTPRACWMPPTWCSSMRREPVSAASRARTRRRPSSASIRTLTPSPSSSRSSSRKYGRWNSPKYLFGESYGTPRSAVVVNQLESDRSIDLNGVILLSQILSFDLSPDRPTGNPGVDLPYQTVLPTYAATAWYHHKLPAEHPQPRDLPDRGGAVRDGRLRARARRRLRPQRQRSQRHRRQAARVHRPAGRVHPQGRPAHRRRRVPPEPAGRRRHHHRPPRQPLLGTRPRPAEPARRLRPAVLGARLGLRLGLQRVRAQGAALRRRQDVQAEHPHVPHLELLAPAAGPGQKARCRRARAPTSCPTSPTR